jgi:hypothetical protein
MGFSTYDYGTIPKQCGKYGKKTIMGQEGILGRK